jgi:spore maturation protein CgeB
MSGSSLRVLLSGSFAPQNYERSWLNWLRDNDYLVQTFTPSVILDKKIPFTRVQRLLWRFYQPALASIVSRAFVRSACAFHPDLVLVVCGRLISADALEILRQKTQATLFHFYGEDFFNPLNTTATLRHAAYLYDRFFTTKTFNVQEMAEIGLKNVTFIPHGYIPTCHVPVKLRQEDIKKYGSDLSFVGTWETERAAMLAQLQEFDLRIWGDYWHKASKLLGLNKAIQSQSVWCEGLSRVFQASKINLAFLRKANRDRHTTRTFEIPACGGFQLSERTDEVLGFFEEGKEIECFDSLEELKDKARYYLQHESQRQQIAAAGLARVQHSRYSDTDHLQTILKYYPGKSVSDR